jgi:hypothetical protein
MKAFVGKPRISYFPRLITYGPRMCTIWVMRCVYGRPTVSRAAGAQTTRDRATALLIDLRQEADIMIWSFFVGSSRNLAYWSST